ncbi:hypothetical protein GGQ74_000059 [Desulfobaculum xiamenense]|uniref:Uncharacterized protein n=1 Tax=Desulfobaculum xiamenense TaxID=995050 RepID=A0A846QNY6_9BACT|nr:hypothetical protein [Desulfobaculum xiamenense]NJB66419.1 hypothetical protein [Desulfobaculum xiamenense]
MQRHDPPPTIDDYAARILDLMERMAAHPEATAGDGRMLEVAAIGVRQVARRVRERRETPRRTRITRELDAFEPDAMEPDQRERQLPVGDR